MVMILWTHLMFAMETITAEPVEPRWLVELDFHIDRLAGDNHELVGDNRYDLLAVSGNHRQKMLINLDEHS